MKARVLALAICVALLPRPALAQAFNQFVGFGDSTIDSGWYRNLAFPTGDATRDALLPAAIANGGGISTTGPGPVSSQLLAGYFGLNGAPADQGGANYATGGSRNNQVGTLPNAVPTVTQIGNYLAANGGVANGSALYLIGSGGNDISLYVGQVNAGTLTLAQGVQSVTQSAADLTAALARLQASGARYIVVRDQPSSFGTATERQLRATYNSALWSGLAAAGVNFVPSDFSGVLTAVTANLSSFGFVAGAGPACVAPAGVTSGYALLCTPQTLVSADAAQTHLFADDLHLSTAGQKIIADYEYSLITAPSMMSMLAEAPVKTRSALVNVIKNQMLVSQRQGGSSNFNTWLSGDVSALTIRNYNGFPDDPGTPATLTAGFDFKIPSSGTIGVALTVGQQRSTFSGNTGGFTQNEFTASVYFAQTFGPVAVDAIASYGTLNFKVDRNVPIGITIQNNTASTSGSNVSLSGNAAYNIKSGAWTHGPIVGVTVQQVHINGFTETGSFTSLGFAGQTRNSAVGDLGYQMLYDAGVWQPFARVTWDHEFASTDRLITTSLTTTVAPSYALPAVTVGRDWLDMTAGTTLKIARNVTGLVALSALAAQNSVTTYGGQVGVNVSF